MVEHLSSRRSMRHRMELARRWAATTPGRLRVLSVEIAVVAIALMAIGSGTAVTALVTVTGIQQQTVPMIVGMQHIHAWLSDADRSAASAYLAGGFDSTVTQLQIEAESTGAVLDLLGRLNPDDAQLRYEADLTAADRQMQRATELTTEGDEASLRLHAVAVAVANYARLIDTAAAAVASDPTAGTVYLQAGSNLMHGRGGILQQVDQLGNLYVRNLSGANFTLQIAGAMLVLYTAVALWLLVLLVRTQRFVRARFRRRRNSGLLAATVLLILVSVGSFFGAAQAAAAVRGAEAGGYPQMLTLWTARSLVYDANDNASMSLIAHGRSTDFDNQFRAETVQLVDRPLTNQLIQGADRGDVRFNGLLADNLRTAETAQERESAMHTLRAYQQFMQANTTAHGQADAVAQQQADAAARTQRATQASSSPSPSPSPKPSTSPTPPPAATPAPASRTSTSDRSVTSAADEVDWYIGASLEMRQTRFDAAMSTGGLMLSVTLFLEVLAIAIAALAFWGLQPRIDEYAI
jgi:hypothetical protein